ncbi:MAG: cytochrome c oxidase subunit II [Solirubrobacterales bacterium]
MSLFIALAGIITGMGALAGPAMAISLNPDAGSPGIDKANTLHWIIFIVVLVAIVVVNLAILRAARPRTRHHTSGSDSPKKGMQLKVGLGLGVLALAIFVTSTVFSDQSRVVPVSTETVADVNADKQLEIVATGQQWLWRFNYPNAAFSYHRLVVPAGVTVALKLVSTDVIHGWNVPSLTGKADAVPGKTNWVYFRADEEGVHTGRSAILSGQGFDTMEAKVEVVSPDAYETYIETLANDIQEAQDRVQKVGLAGATDDSASALEDDAQDTTMKTAEADDDE